MKARIIDIKFICPVTLLLSFGFSQLQKRLLGAVLVRGYLACGIVFLLLVELRTTSRS